MRDLAQLENGIDAALKRGDTPSANAMLRNQEALLNRELSASPSDLMLLGFKGYLHKNQAVLYQQTNASDKATIELINSERAFQAVLVAEPKVPDVLTGLGDVAVLRGDLDRGEQWVREALEIAPGNQEALQELRRIEEVRELRLQQ